MKRMFFAISLFFAVSAAAQDNLRPSLEATYNAWREAMIRKDGNAWQRVTAEHRRVEVRNLVVSRKLPYPAAVFALPAPPPAIQRLTFLEAKQNGPTAKAAYFGKVDFGVGGEPTDNLLVLSFTRGSASWLYDRADFVNLSALPQVRKELAAGNLKYLRETPDSQPSGKVPITPISVNTAKVVAKVYVFCPGREVQVQINKVSRHRFANAKEAEVVIGGAVSGSNEVQFSTKKLPGATGKEVMTIRVYLMSGKPGVKPIKSFEYQIAAGEAAKPFGSGSFVLNAATVARLEGK